MVQSLFIENVSKRYRLGTIGSGTASEDIKRWWNVKVLGRSDPLAQLAPAADHGNRDGNILWALRNVSFTVGRGEVIGIIGKNGAGKSTLLKILSQITAPTSGCIRVNGRLASLLEVGTGFNGELTGRENIFLNGGILGMTPREIRRRFDEIVEFAEIEDFIETPVKRYSSGMYVRLAFSVAAHLEADIMVIDEVLAVGDIGFQKKCLGKMSDASSAGRTVLFVSHRMDHITALCPRSVVLDAGRLIYDGETQQAVQRYYGLFEKEQDEPLARPRQKDWRSRVTIVSAHVENEFGERVSLVASGGSLTFVVNLESAAGRSISNLKLSIFLYTADGTHLSDLGIWESGAAPFSVEGRARVRVTVPRLPLNRGQYRFSAVVRSAGGAYEIDDMVENLGSFTVDFGDFHGIGSAVGGLFSIDHSVSVDQLAEESL